MFTLKPLPYAFGALEPYIDARTMELHHDMHQAAYVNNLNNALKDYPDLQQESLEYMLIKLEDVPAPIREAVRNNAGGDFNHSMFWTLMSPKGGGEPKGRIAEAIRETFGSFEAFKDLFNKTAKKVFGSGWAWLCLDENMRLIVTHSPNQDSPLSIGLKPIMGLDVWEHAYYLQYQNRRPDYIAAWWHVVNWEQVEQNYCMLIKR